jgi:hypothetical protein
MPNQNKEKDLLDLLDIIILKMMLVEKIEDFQIENHYNKMLIKNTLNNALRILTPTAERDYAIVFSNGEKETQQIITEYEILIAQIRDLNVPQMVILSQMIQAYNLEPKSIEGIIHKVLKSGTSND